MRTISYHSLSLTRSAADLPRAAKDPKVPHAPGAPWPVYLPADEDRAAVAAALARVVPARDLKSIDLRLLPRDPSTVGEHGLLYLPRAYVVPGGRFNEMYGWDSYFIQVGLLLDGEVDRARDLADNFVYEIDQYGTLLNAKTLRVEPALGIPREVVDEVLEKLEDTLQELTE